MMRTTSALASLALAAGLSVGLAQAAFAQSALELGVQGRPHGGSTAQRMFAYRHGLGHYRYHGRYHRLHRGYSRY